MTLTRRMALMMACVLLLALGGSLAIHSVSARQALQQQLEVQNRDAAAGLALALSQQHGDAVAMQMVVAAQFDLGHYRQIRLQGSDGAALIDLQLPARPSRAPSWFISLLPIAAEPGRAVVSDGWRELGALRVDAQVAWAQEALWDACTHTAALLGALAAAAALVSGWLLRAWQRPLRATVAQAEALEQGRFVEAAEPRLPELRHLTRSMNSMVRRLREVYALQAEQVALLQRQAQLDAVTGLALRQQFVGQLQRRLAEPGGPGAALILVRVLHLDALNPRLGHEATDRLLGGIADVLLTYVDRVPGAFAGRLNGSDFALCLPVPGVAGETAQSLRAALSAAPALRSGEAQIAIAGADGLRNLDGGAALAVADAVLARAEAAEEGLAVESQAELNVTTAGARAWREQIAAALAQGRTQLAEFGVVDREGRLIHLECPLRVQMQPDGEFEAASRWLALARRSRLMPEVDLAALQLALVAIGRDGRARAVHASLASLAAPGFVAEVTRQLRSAPEAARRLSIECVEGLGTTESVPLAEAALAWRPLGVRLGVEHAGATPQQLPRLQAAGIDYVKVDARHLRGLAAQEAVRGYALGLLRLIHGLGLTALAEGIDDAGDLAAVWALGFDGATGPAVGATAVVEATPARDASADAD